MKLLLGQNRSHILAGNLADVFPGSAHVRDFGLQSADDQVVWDFARDREYTIVSKRRFSADELSARCAPEGCVAQHWQLLDHPSRSRDSETCDTPDRL